MFPEDDDDYIPVMPEGYGAEYMDDVSDDEKESDSE